VSACDEIGELDQVGDVEGRSSRRHDDEGVGRDDVGPLGGQ